MTPQSKKSTQTPTFRRIVSRILNSIRKHPYPVIVSFWVGVIFAERLATDQVVHGVKHSLGESVQSTATVFCFLTVSLFVLVAMLVDRQSVAEGRHRVVKFLKTVLKEVFSPLLFFLLAFSLLFIFLARGAVTGKQFPDTIVEWVTGLKDLLTDVFAPPVLVLIGIVGLVSVVWLIVYYLLRTKVRTVEEAIHETVIGAYFVFASVGFYLWLYYVVIFPHWTESARPHAIGGLLKDTVVYLGLTLVLVVGTYKAGEALRALKGDFHRWLVFAILAAGTAFFTVAALWFEFSFKDNVLLQGKSPEYPLESQWRLIALHIMLRDFGLMMPLLFVIFLRFLGGIEKVNLELRGIKT